MTNTATNTVTNTVTDTMAEWSILVYIAAHNNLDQWGKRSLDQILAAGSTAQVKLAVLYDGQTEARRLLVGESGQSITAEALQDFDSGDPAALVETAKWAFGQARAKRYGLVLWSHGTGWRPEEIERVAVQARGDDAVSQKEATERATRSANTALFRSTLSAILQKESPTERAICFDDGTQHSLDTLMLEQVMRQIQSVTGQPLDLLGMDACLMATAEVAYQVRKHVKHLVASEELVPVTSWPYDTILGTLRKKPETDARTLAAQIVADFAAYYEANPPSGGDVTKVALDLSQVASLVDPLGVLSDSLIADMPNQADALWAAQFACLTKESKNQQRLNNKFKVHLWDIRTVAQHLAMHNDPTQAERATQTTNATVKAAAEAVIAAIAPGRFVLAERHQGSWFDGLGGVSIYFLLPKRIRMSPDYASVALAQESRWQDMLRAYDAEIKTR